MNKIKDLNGIIGVINTPFTKVDKIDQPSIRKYVNHSIDCGVVGFLVPAMAAEVHKLNFEERKLIVETVLDEVNGRVKVIGGASAHDHSSRLKYAELLNSMGCNGVLVNIPFDNEKVYLNCIKEVSDKVDGFLMVQDWDFEGFGISIELIVKLYNEIENFKYLKVEVKPAGVKYTKILEATDGKLHVSGGWAGTQMIEALDRGVDAFMPTILHDVYNKIFQLHKNGKREESLNLFNKLLPIISFSHQHLDISIHFNKRLMYKQGIFSTPNVRDPILPFDEYHESVADELIEYSLKLKEEK